MKRAESREVTLQAHFGCKHGEALVELVEPDATPEMLEISRERLGFRAENARDMPCSDCRKAHGWSRERWRATLRGEAKR